MLFYSQYHKTWKFLFSREWGRGGGGGKKEEKDREGRKKTKDREGGMEGNEGEEINMKKVKWG